jgi:predicted RNase H-like HicB family nuclease
MNQTLQYMVVLEQGTTSYGAYVPDLPGCIAVGEHKEEVLELIKEAIELHLEMLTEQGLSIPKPCSTGELVEVAA